MIFSSVSSDPKCAHGEPINNCGTCRSNKVIAELNDTNEAQAERILELDAELAHCARHWRSEVSKVEIHLADAMAENKKLEDLTTKLNQDNYSLCGDNADIQEQLTQANAVIQALVNHWNADKSVCQNCDINCPALNGTHCKDGNFGDAMLEWAEQQVKEGDNVQS